MASAARTSSILKISKSENPELGISKKTDFRDQNKDMKKFSWDLVIFHFGLGFEPSTYIYTLQNCHTITRPWNPVATMYNMDLDLLVSMI